MDMFSEFIGTDYNMGNELEEAAQGEEYGNTAELEVNAGTNEELGESETFTEEEEEVLTQIVYVANDSGQYGITAEELQIALSPITALLLILVASIWIKSITRKGRSV